MKLYLACKVNHGLKLKEILTKLDPNITITSRWLDYADKNLADLNTEELCRFCIEDVKNSDAVLFYIERDDELVGALIEVGMAIALNIPVYFMAFPVLSSINNKHYSIFMDYIGWNFFKDFTDLKDYLKDLNKVERFS